MPELQEVEVFIRPDGTVELKVRGVKGPRCREITAGLERALGGAVVSCEPTAEYNEVPLDEQDQQQLQGGVNDGRSR